MSKVLVVDHNKCTGCRACEMYCSLQKTGTCNPARSRIRVIKWEEEGINVPTVCMQCQDPLCAMTCPVDAIRRDGETGILSVDADRCVGCKMCVMVCPFGIPSIDVGGDGKSMICDQCKGNPTCLGACSTGALQYIEADKMSWLRRRLGISKMVEAIQKKSSDY